MSKVETDTNDAKKLALRCKTLEMQLRQSIPKKEHHEITTKLEKQIDSLEKELDRAREATQRTIAINKQIAGVEDLISTLIKTANAQGKILDSIEDDASARGKALGAQGKTLDALAAKISQGTVPSQVYLQSLSRIEKLEEDKRGMVRRFDYNSLEARCEELSRQIGTMVPSADFAALKERFDEATRQIADMVPASDYAAVKLKTEELEGAIYTMVPREKFISSQQRVAELEARLAEHVPQTVYDELVAKVMSLAEAVSGGAPQSDEAREETQLESVEAVAEPGVEVTVPDAPTPESHVEVTVPETVVAEASVAETAIPGAPEEVAIPEAVAGPQVEAAVPEAAVASSQEVSVSDTPAVGATASPDSTPEVREIQSQLAELGGQANEAHNDIPSANAQAPEAEVAATKAASEIAVASAADSSTTA